ncbi:MAG: four helix bundle protein [Candidatus Pacebacteria bacterium]|nr:four helix bundle protein [Candidatus Paceibacterota bacterium]
MKTYKDLIVWQKGVQLVVLIYKLLNNFPKEEVFGLSSQIKRSAISIPSNIAEGKMRGSNNEFKRFLLIAYGSGAELETQIEISKKLEKTKKLDYKEIDELLLEIMKILNKLIKELEPKA